MSNGTLLGLGCLPPFLLETDYPKTGGFAGGRYCAALPITNGLSCCLPCMQATYAYGDAFMKDTEIANWVSIVSTICCVIVLLSHAALPNKVTNRTYLNTSIVISILILSFAFVIPMGVKPDPCYDAITPHDMKSDRTCAASSTFLFFGAWCCISWIFLCALTLHFQIVWQKLPTRKIWLAIKIGGWLGPAFFTVESLAISGASYRFGRVCIINEPKSIADFWVWVSLFAGLTLIVQFSTIGYCIKVFVSSRRLGPHLDIVLDTPQTDGSFASLKRAKSRQAYEKMMGVVKMHYRGAIMVLIVVSDIIFFCTVFLLSDSRTRLSAKTAEDALPWLECLALNDKKTCLHLAPVVAKSTVLAALVLLAINGLWVFVLIGHWSWWQAWIEISKDFYYKHFRGGRRRSSPAMRQIEHEMHMSPGRSPRKTPDSHWDMESVHAPDSQQPPLALIIEKDNGCYKEQKRPSVQFSPYLDSPIGPRFGSFSSPPVSPTGPLSTPPRRPSRKSFSPSWTGRVVPTAFRAREPSIGFSDPFSDRGPPVPPKDAQWLPEVREHGPLSQEIPPSLLDFSPSSSPVIPSSHRSLSRDTIRS